MIDFTMFAYFVEKSTEIILNCKKICQGMKKNFKREVFLELLKKTNGLRTSSELLNFDPLTEFIYKVEDLIILLRDEVIDYNDSSKALLLEIYDYIKDWISKIDKDHNYNHDTTEMITKINLFIEQNTKDPAIVPVLFTDSKNITEYNLDSDLVISNIEDILTDLKEKINSNEKIKIIIKSQIVDTSGLQLMATLKRNRKCQITITDNKVIEKIQKFGAGDILK